MAKSKDAVCIMFLYTFYLIFFLSGFNCGDMTQYGARCGTDCPCQGAYKCSISKGWWIGQLWITEGTCE